MIKTYKRYDFKKWLKAFKTSQTRSNTMLAVCFK